uniref:DNA-directed RNA polymerases I and III subunit RPAC1 n=1 Tax=Romanomermis culicivorax TaxID=13658 RepID=A0A915L0E5_ROMCU
MDKVCPTENSSIFTEKLNLLSRDVPGTGAGAMTYGTDYGDDDREPWDKNAYCKNIRIKIINNRGDDLEFDLINVEAPFANALRRILLAEVPSMAIDRVFLYQNTSLIQDEIFCHRLGMIPIKVDPRRFSFRKDIDDEKDVKPENTLEFGLHVKCTKNKSSAKDSKEEENLYLNSRVYSKDLKWIPVGDQATKFAECPPSPVHPDILLNKLRPGQEIELKCHCVKGIGRDHAKFSPVATASYRLLPEIILNKEIYGEAAERLKNSFSEGVVEIEEDENGV